MGTIDATKIESELAPLLGPAMEMWNSVISAIEETSGAIVREWKPSKNEFGWLCLLKLKKRTLLYMIPEKETVRVAIVLGERAVALALASSIPDEFKVMFREARQYADGRGIRFPVNSDQDIDAVKKLIAIKTTPK